MAKKPAKAQAPREVAIAAPPAPPPTHPPPVALASILGQDRAAHILTDALRSGRIHHAWIFHGPAGVGKFTTALAFAALLLDPTTQATLTGSWSSDPDGETARLLASGAHPDLHVVRKELARYHEDRSVREKKLTNIPVDVIRTFLLEPGNLAAAVTRASRASKVFIIDEAELLAIASQNAVLKFLEEPPDRTVIVLVTSSEEALLPTIRSRCQRVPFSPLSPADMKAWLKPWLKDSGQSLPANSDWLLDFAQGAPGVLAAAVKLNLGAWAESLTPMLALCAQGRYVPELGPACHALVDEFAQAAEKASPNASKDAANKAGADWMLRLFSRHWAQALRQAQSDTPRTGALTSIDALRAAEREIDANVNQLFVFEKLSSEFAAAHAGEPAPAR